MAVHEVGMSLAVRHTQSAELCRHGYGARTADLALAWIGGKPRRRRTFYDLTESVRAAHLCGLKPLFNIGTRIAAYDCDETPEV